MRSPSNVPLSSQISETGSFVTIRCSGLKLIAFHPKAEFIMILLKCPVGWKLGFTFGIGTLIGTYLANTLQQPAKIPGCLE
jgi:hypothetical protein